MKKIIYFDADYENESGLTPTEMSVPTIMRELMLKYEEGNDNIHIYDTVEDFAEAFNNEWISDLGYIRAVDVRDTVQIFKENGVVTDEERQIIEKRAKILATYDDKANGYVAFDLNTKDLGVADHIVNILNEINAYNPNWYVGNPYEEYVYVD